MGKQAQPTQEQFENNLATQLHQMDRTKALWLEDESITIGKRIIPNPLWNQMRSAEVIKLSVPKKHRIAFLVKGYSALDQQFLIDSTERIGKRLGPKQTRDAVLAIKEGRMEECVEIVLFYYDKTYLKGQSNRLSETIHEVECADTNPYTNSRNILKYLKKNIISL